MAYIDMIKERAKRDIKTIVLPESTDKRPLIAASTPQAYNRAVGREFFIFLSTSSLAFYRQSPIFPVEKNKAQSQVCTTANGELGEKLR